jgi:hypothetical protein
MRERIKTVRLGRWTLTLYDTGKYDNRGCTRLAYRVRQDGKAVAWSRDEYDAVCGSPLHADDSDETAAAAVALIAHDACHNCDDQRIECGWDADGFSDEGSMRWPNF